MNVLSAWAGASSRVFAHGRRSCPAHPCQVRWVLRSLHPVNSPVAVTGVCCCGLPCGNDRAFVLLRIGCLSHGGSTMSRDIYQSPVPLKTTTQLGAILWGSAGFSNVLLMRSPHSCLQFTGRRVIFYDLQSSCQVNWNQNRLQPSKHQNTVFGKSHAIPSAGIPA